MLLNILLFLGWTISGTALAFYILEYRPMKKDYERTLIYSTEATNALSVYKASVDMGERKNGNIILDESIITAIEHAIRRRLEATEMVQIVHKDAEENPEKYANA